MFSLTDLRNKDEKRTKDLRAEAEKLKDSVDRQILLAHNRGMTSTLIQVPSDTRQEVCALIAREIRLGTGMRAEVDLKDPTRPNEYGIAVSDIRKLETTSIRKPHNFTPWCVEAARGRAAVADNTG